MIDKNADSTGTPDAELLAQTCQYLESSTLQAQSNVRSTFLHLYEALQSREKQLLRQIDVAHSQQMAVLQSSADNALLDRIPHVTVQLDSMKALKEAISSLGSVGLQGAGLVVFNGDGTFLQRVEDYQDATQDHMSMYKPLPLDGSTSPGQDAIIRFNRVSLPHTLRSCPFEGDKESVSCSSDGDEKEAECLNEGNEDINYSNKENEEKGTECISKDNENTKISCPSGEMYEETETNGSNESDASDETSYPIEQDEGEGSSKSGEVTDEDRGGNFENHEHPAQVQQWLKQISAETETEPCIGEPKNFASLNSTIKAT